MKKFVFTIKEDVCTANGKDEAKLKQELAVFEKIKDNYPKCIITMDQVFVPDHGGVKTISVYDFLMGACWS